MSRRICCICLALSVLIATVSIAYADAVPAAPLTEQDYREAVLALEEQGLQTGFASGLTSTQRLYENDLPAGGEDASITQLQFLALDEMEAEQLAQQAAREQLASNLALLSQYDGVKLSGSATVYSDAGVTATSGKIESGKVAKLKDIDATGRWFLVAFANMTGYISADLCTPVSYKDYDGTDAVRTRAQILARSNAAAAKTFGTGVVPGGSTLRSVVVHIPDNRLRRRKISFSAGISIRTKQQLFELSEFRFRSLAKPCSIELDMGGRSVTGNVDCFRRG